MRVKFVSQVPDRVILAWRAHGGRLGLAFSSKTEAARVLKMTSSQVNDVCQGRRPHAHGWVFIEGVRGLRQIHFPERA